MDDDLLKWRAEFPALQRCVHLISHSLGCVPRRAHEYVALFLHQWATESISAWEEWIPEVDRSARRLERILGAAEGTIAMRTNVSEVQAVVASCFDYTAERNKIVYTGLQFPTVSYVWKAEERRGAKVHIVPSQDGISVDVEALCAAIDERTVAVPVSHVLYSSAFVQDARRIAERAAEVGAHVVLDCYQSAGTIPLALDELGVSFACGGSVKYLCGGPGAAYLYVRPDLIAEFEPRVTGWFANRSPFAFTMPDQTYADSAWRYMGGTPAVAALYQARAGQEIIGEIGVAPIREKSLRQTGAIIDQVDERGMTLRSPRAAANRGGSVVFDFEGADEVARELNRRRFYCDHRPQAGIRVAPHFYTKDEEIDLFFREVDRLRG